MKKLYSLIKACMSSDMSLFKIKTNKKSKLSKIGLPLLFSFFLMFTIWVYANALFEKFTPFHLQFIVISLVVFFTSIMTIVEGIYKTSSLLYNCKDDQLLLSLPIKKRTILFVRILKFYLFELIYNSMFIIPLIIAYLRWADKIPEHFFLTSIIMILTLPIIPIAISCIIGGIISNISSRFKYKKITQTIVSIIFLVLVLYASYNLENIINYLVKNASSINDIITKLYYPAGIFASLAVKFNLTDLLIYIIVNIVVFTITIYLLNISYFKINSRLKSITTVKKVNNNKIVIRKNSINNSLIKKELSTFLETPVFIINAGFGLVLYLIAVIIITIKFDSLLKVLVDPNGLNIKKELILNNTSVMILLLVSVTAFMTSISNSLISLEGKNINILKSLPISPKRILDSKINTCLFITSPILLLGNIILFIKFKIKILEAILLLVLSILLPLVSHLVGLIINLKYPKLDYENQAEVIKQSTSSFISVTIGMILCVISYYLVLKVIGKVQPLLILSVTTLVFIIIDLILYLYLNKVGIKEFKKLSI